MPQFYHAGDRLPLDTQALSYTLSAPDAQAQVLSAEGSAPYEGPVTYSLHADVQEPADATTATLRIGESLFRGAPGEESNDTLLDAKVWQVVTDRTTGEITQDASLQHTLASPTTTVPVDGLVLKFPANAEKTTYPVFDTFLRQSRDAVFEEELELGGRTIYRYHQSIDPINVATLYASVLGTTQMEDSTGYYHHSGSRDFYVDQETGIIVGLDVDFDDYYADREGNRGPQALRLNASLPQEQQDALLELADSIPTQQSIDTIRLSLLIGGGLLTLLGLIGVIASRGRTTP